VLKKIKLQDEDYKILIQEILKRDNYSCRKCKSKEHLQAHHVIKRSKIRLDLDWNLITVCYRCHFLLESHQLLIEQDESNLFNYNIDCNKLVKFTRTHLERTKAKRLPGKSTR